MQTLIFLTGMPGSGKSTIGKLLAQKTGYAFVDLDAEVEKTSGKSIKQVFADEGEDKFRETEHNCLLHIIKEAEQNTVISLGGGTIAFHNNIDHIKKAGTLVYLKVSTAILVERLKNETANRPLLKASDPDLKINLLFSLREKFYMQADLIVDANGISDEIAGFIYTAMNAKT